MAFKHDRRYKRIFSNPYFIEKLLVSFVEEPFVNKLDFSSLQRLDKSYISEDFKEKESDLIYSVKYRNSIVYIFLLIEFQSSVDKLMALRFLRYIAEFYETNKQFMTDGKFPSVFPLLLYSGDKKWTAHRQISKLIKSDIPEKYIPHFEYYTICENEIPKKSLVRIKNAVSALFYVENSSPQELLYNIDVLVEIIKDENLEIINEISGWLNNYFESMDNSNDTNYLRGKIESLQEVKTMFATELEKYGVELKEEGKKEGIEEGIKEGRKDGRHEGLREGRQEEQVSVILKMKRKGLSSERIAELLDLDVDFVEGIE